MDAVNTMETVNTTPIETKILIALAEIRTQQTGMDKTLEELCHILTGSDGNMGLSQRMAQTETRVERVEGDLKRLDTKIDTRFDTLASDINSIRSRRSTDRSDDESNAITFKYLVDKFLAPVVASLISGALGALIVNALLH